MAERLPRAEKLPLAVRKSLRDDWEAKKEDLEKELSKVLDTPWTFSVDTNQIWPYAQNSWAKDNLGRVIADYFDGNIRRIDEYTQKYGAEGVKELNTICHTHVMTLDVDMSGKFPYSGGDIHEGQLRLLFQKDNFGSNANTALEHSNIMEALNQAEDPESKPLSFAARTSIRKQYDPQIKSVEDKIKELLGKPLALTPNWEANFAKLKEESKKKKTELRKDWETGFGNAVLGYFQGVAYQLEWKKFEDDDMLQEGFFDAVEKAEVQLRVVDKLEKRHYNESKIEDGVLVLQTTPHHWNSNVNDPAENIVDLL
ncbi:hypothetical protein F5Y16DRAFT_363247 [Xylariaceae sp. FL0255]|nr:hypothetical protein F5Y16DRAFT_363247 [Xylariaceae sp. FL0255]